MRLDRDTYMYARFLTGTPCTSEDLSWIPFFDFPFCYRGALEPVCAAGGMATHTNAADASAFLHDNPTVISKPPLNPHVTRKVSQRGTAVLARRKCREQCLERAPVLADKTVPFC